MITESLTNFRLGKPKWISKLIDSSSVFCKVELSGGVACSLGLINGLIYQFGWAGCLDLSIKCVSMGAAMELQCAVCSGSRSLNHSRLPLLLATTDDDVLQHLRKLINYLTRAHTFLLVCCSCRRRCYFCGCCFSCVCLFRLWALFCFYISCGCILVVYNLLQRSFCF